MLIASFSVLLPVLFVMSLGYWAGRTRRFDADQTRGINDLVMTYALPSLMFVATVTTTRSELLAEASFLLALLIAFLGLYMAVVLMSVLALHHSIGAAGLQAFLITFPSVAFFGIPIFRGLFGEESLLSIASADVLASITIAPLTVVLLEIHAQHSASIETKPIGTLVWNGLANSFSKPMVWAPLAGAMFVLFDIDFPSEVDHMLSLIGSTTGGTSLFLAGLITASYSIRISGDVLLNVIGKMILQPALMGLLLVLFAIPDPLGREGILMCAIPASAVGPILAAHYRVYEIESASTVVLDSLLMVGTFTIAVLLTDG
jgi:malonate transporter and related proteins